LAWKRSRVPQLLGKDGCGMLQEFAGNEDRSEERQQFLKSPFIARYVRIHPTNWHRHIGLRAGLLGCPYVG